MKLKNIMLIVGLLALVAMAFYVYKKKNSGTLNPSLVEFAVPDTAAITKVLLADRRGNSILLEREAVDRWKLNGSYKARQDAMATLLKTIMKVEVKMPVPQTAHNNIVRLLAGNSTKVEVYQGKKLVKTYYVGDGTQDHEGTYMAMEGANVPYICHIPGFRGFLTPRYFTRINEWRDTELFRYPRISEIAEIKVDFHQNPKNSYRVTRSREGKYSVELTTQGLKLPVIDTTAVRRYVHQFSVFHYERVAEYPQNVVDSIAQSIKYFTVTVRDAQGKTRTLETWRVKVLPGTLGFDDKPIEWDSDRMNARIDGNTTEMVLVQYYNTDRITVFPEYFTRPVVLE